MPHCLKKVDWNEAWAAVKCANNFYSTGYDYDTRCAYSYVSAIRRQLTSYVRQRAGRPSTGSTGTTVSIFLGRNSEARELHAELGVVEASRREARVPREGDPVSALPTTPSVPSTSGSSPCCLLDVRLVLLGLGEAIFANNSLLSACAMSDTYPCS